MPVISPSRYSTGLSTGSYRNSISTAGSLDKGYCRSTGSSYVSTSIRNSYGDRTTEYRSRYTDSDGKRERKTSLVEYTRSTRAPSVAEEGRSRAERSESRGRELRNEKSYEVRKRSAISTAALAMSTADLYNMYSPANYVPLSMRVAQSGSNDIARSKSISSDIGRPPLESRGSRKGRPTVGSVSTIAEIPTGRYENGLTNGDSPSAGYENKTFEHENYIKKRNEERQEAKAKEEAKGMDTSTESDLTDDSRKDDSDNGQDFGGKSGVSRRSADKSDLNEANERGPNQASGLNGLRNIGNTCFMNSVLQGLSNTKPLLEYLSDDTYMSDINTTLSPMKGALIKAFASVIKELWRAGEKDSVVNTTSLKSQVQRFAPRFMGYSQQDAQEFLRYLLEGLHEDVNRVSVKPKPLNTEIDENLSDTSKAAEAWARYLRTEDSHVGDIFVGQLKSTLRCTHCNHDSVTFDPFWDLSLPIPSRSGALKLQQCLQLFTKEEELDGDEKPTCSKCGVRRKCLKWFTVQKFPQVLVLHLKRFSPTERFRGKLSVPIEFPLNGLDMSPYAANKNTKAYYNLYAVSNHSGTTYSGHYTAYCKHPYTSEWHEYNDTRVSSISPRTVVSPEAYVLFYELAKSS